MKSSASQTASRLCSGRCISHRIHNFKSGKAILKRSSNNKARAKSAAPKVKGKHGGSRLGAGGPKFVPTESDRTTVMFMMAGGFSQEEIAMCLGEKGISDLTLRRNFSNELRMGKAKINSICVGGIVRAMTKGDAWALCFWAKTRLRWRENGADTNYDPTADEGMRDLVTAINNSPSADDAPVTALVQ